MLVTMDFLGLGAMFTELFRIGCSFSACSGVLAKYQTYLIFHRPSLPLDPYHGYAHLVTVLSCLSTSCRSHFLSCPVLPACHNPVPRHHSMTGRRIHLDFFRNPDVSKTGHTISANRAKWCQEGSSSPEDSTLPTLTATYHHPQ